MPAPSCPKIAGNNPSGSAPERVNSSVWQTPLALISTNTSPALGPSKSTVMISRGLRAAVATAALVFISGYPCEPLERYGRSTGAELEAVNDYRIHPERGTSHRLPDREGDHHSRSVSPVVECPDQCLQSENQPRTGARLERG